MAPNIIESNLENVSVIVLTIATIHQSLQINSYSSSMRITFYWVSSQYLNVAIAVNSDKQEMDGVNTALVKYWWDGEMECLKAAAHVAPLC